MVQSAVERVFHALDLPRRCDIEALTANLERVAKALERLERGRRARALDRERRASRPPEPGAAAGKPAPQLRSAPTRSRAWRLRQPQTDSRSRSPTSTSAWICARSSSVSRESSSSSRGGVGAEVAERERLADPDHPLASAAAARRAGRASGKVGVTGRNGRPMARAGAVHLNRIGCASSAPTMPTGTSGDAGLERDAHHAAAAEALEPVALAEDLGGALHALRKRDHEAAGSEQALGVLAARAHAAEPRQVRLHEGQRHQPVGHQEARALAAGCERSIACASIRPS